MKNKTIEAAVTKILHTTKESVSFVVLYGSTARNETLPVSDIDLGVMLQKNSDTNFEIELELAGLYDPDGDPPIQITLLNNAPIALLYQVVRDGHILYEENQQVWPSFVEYVISRYPDWRMHIDRYLTESLGAI